MGFFRFKKERATSIAPPVNKKERLTPTREASTRRVEIGGKKIYITRGEYPDGRLGEIFIRLDKEGGELRVYECLAIAISIGLQHGIPLSAFSEKLLNQKMEPAGVTNDKSIPLANSIIDYVFRYLLMRYDDEGNKRKWWRRVKTNSY